MNRVEHPLQAKKEPTPSHKEFAQRAKLVRRNEKGGREEIGKKKGGDRFGAVGCGTVIKRGNVRGGGKGISLDLHSKLQLIEKTMTRPKEAPTKFNWRKPRKKGRVIG